MLPPKNIIVIGGNAAGPAAAAKAKRVSPDSNVTLFEAGSFISTGTCELPYLLSGEISDYRNLVFFTPESFEKEKGVKVLVNHFVEKIDRREKTITVRNSAAGQSFKQDYCRLIIATGSRAKRLASVPPGTRNYFTLKSVQDYMWIKKFMDESRVHKVAIIGAGYVGLEAAESFVKLKKSVFIVEKEKLPLPGLEPEIRNLVNEVLASNGVEFFGGAQNYRFIFNNSQIANIVIDGRSIEVDLVLSSIGFEPESRLAISANLLTGNWGGIKVDSRLRTSDPSIYAAGDCIEVQNKISGRADYILQATIAHSFGHIAGENAAGGNSIAHPVIKNLSVKIFDKFVTQTGLSSCEIEDLRKGFGSVSAIVPNLVKIMPGSRNVFGKILFDIRSLMILGAQFIGGGEVSGYSDLISAFIQNQIKATELSKLALNYTPPLSPFINLLSVLGRKIEKEKT